MIPEALLLEKVKPKPSEHKDFKQKSGYPKSVTVCIAASCQEGKESRVVLCSDTRIDYAEFGSTNVACKLDVLGHGWCVQMAGDWSSAIGLNSTLKERIRTLSSVETADVLKESEAAVKQFMKSPLYDSNKEVQLLLSGFEDTTPCIVEISIIQGNKKVELKHSFGVVGWGTTIAATLLTLREHNESMPLAYVAYLVYEAKRASEKTGFVGRFTTLVVQSPNISDFKDKAYVKIMGEAGLAQLEAYYRGLWKIPVARFPDLTPEMFLNSKEPQSPQ